MLGSGGPPGVTEQNLQARCRGVLLMAISNQEGRLLLTTGNKSEIATGYCTLYGDMCGALSVIADLPKMLVYDVARWLNQTQPTIPLATIEKPPSAELAPDQRDDDSLPPYPILDDILERWIVRLQPRDMILAAGHAPETVDRVLRLVDIAEYKRRQAAPGLRVTPRAFGVGRRMPIAAAFRAPSTPRPFAPGAHDG
jgi:NAD+ synthase (glutamine-hydrolysing)